MRKAAAPAKAISSPPPRSTPAARSAPATLDSHYLLAALRALRKGDFSVRLPIGLTGIDGEIGEALRQTGLLPQ